MFSPDSFAGQHYTGRYRQSDRAPDYPDPREIFETTVRKSLYPRYQSLGQQVYTLAESGLARRVSVFHSPFEYFKGFSTAVLSSENSNCTSGEITFRPEQTGAVSVVRMHADLNRSTEVRASFNSARTPLVENLSIYLRNGGTVESLDFFLELAALTGIGFDNPTLTFDLNNLSVDITDPSRRLVYCFDQHSPALHGRWSKFPDTKTPPGVKRLPPEQYAGMLELALSVPVFK